MAEAMACKERAGALGLTPVQKVRGMMQQSEAGLRRVRSAPLFSLIAALATFAGGDARADKIQNPIAVFAALDKVTGRISHLEIPINQTVQFGALKVTPRVCYTRPPTEPPDTASFIEVDEIKLNGEVERIFTGWMFAESPGLHAVEHPVFDVWLTSCKTNEPVTPAGSEQNAAAPGTPPAAAADAAPAAEAPAEAAPAPAPVPAPPPKPAAAAKPATAAAPAAAAATPPAAPPKKRAVPKPAPPPSTFPIFGQ
jgi:hypothetical protein